MSDLTTAMATLGSTVAPAVHMTSESLGSRGIPRVLVGAVALTRHGVPTSGPVEFLVGEDGLEWRDGEAVPARGLPLRLGPTAIALGPLPGLLSEEELARVEAGVPVATPEALAWLALCAGDIARVRALLAAATSLERLRAWVERWDPETLAAVDDLAPAQA